MEVTRISSLNVELGEYIDVSEEQNLVNEAVNSASCLKINNAVLSLIIYGSVFEVMETILFPKF